MRLATIHTTSMGRVLNPSTANGVQITDNKGQVLELRIVDDCVRFYMQGAIITADLMADINHVLKLRNFGNNA